MILFGRIVATFLAVALACHTAVAQPLRIYAAGSLTNAFVDIIKAFPSGSNSPASFAIFPVFGPSGLLRERIEHGEPADILASADMEQPRALARDHPGRFVIMFTRNRMCALGVARLGLTSDNLLDRMLDPAVRLATSTPHADPSGDYAWAVFARAEALRPGAAKALEAKALQLVGGPNTPPLVAGHGAVQGVFLANRADMMLTYCSGSDPVTREVPDLVSVPLPANLTVGPGYGLIVLTDQPLAARFALFVLSEKGQAILSRHGFSPIGLPGP